MAKKRAKTRSVSKSKSKNNVKSQPLHFSGLNFNKKIISIILIVLVLGIIGVMFPDAGITGQVSRTGIFDMPILRDLGWALDSMINYAFGTIPEGDVIVYEKFVLFLLLFAVLSTAAKLLNFRGMTNVVVAGAISLIAVWAMPNEIIGFIGFTYSSIYAAALILIPILMLGYVAWKIPGTRGGCAAKAVIFFVVFAVLGVAKENMMTKYAVSTYYFTNFADMMILVTFLLAIYYLLKAIFMGEESQKKAMKRWRKKELGESFAGVIVNETQKGLGSGIKKYWKSRKESIK